MKDSTKCLSCGHEVPTTSKFCPNCGQEIVADTEETLLPPNKLPSVSVYIMIILTIITAGFYLAYWVITRAHFFNTQGYGTKVGWFSTIVASTLLGLRSLFFVLQTIYSTLSNTTANEIIAGRYEDMSSSFETASLICLYLSPFFLLFIAMILRENLASYNRLLEDKGYKTASPAATGISWFYVTFLNIFYVQHVINGSSRLIKKPGGSDEM